jgi:Mg2+-importing ATPase
VLDRAVLKYREVHEKFPVEKSRKIDEIPFDFSRRMMSVVVETPDKDHRLLTKGAPESVFPRCSFYELEGKIHPMEPILVGDLMNQYQELSSDGFRVLAVAYKHLEPRSAYSKDDESELILKGYVAFLDPPKETAPIALAALNKIGVTVKVLTGDNDLVTRKICKEVGLPVDKLVLGSQVETMTDEELAASAEQVHVFARVSPAHKQRIIRVLQQKQHVVGFLGDGINDAPALRVADVGISVDTGVDIAKELATVILLEKNLMVLEEGVIEGRKVFVNILKYIRMGASSNFGNMFSVLGASAFLPYVPMAPLQVLTNNLLYDFSQVPIPTDNVGLEETAKPRRWLLGLVPGSGFPDWLVRRIADHANADYPCDSHQENPFSSGPGQLAPYYHDGCDHLHRHVAAVLATCRCVGFHASAAALLANTPGYAALLPCPHPNRENVADAQVVAINRGRLVSCPINNMATERASRPKESFLYRWTDSDSSS